ncbi:MAG: NAD(P)(+) transhydrogenase (Re/Si-specific) subunit beta, partial [Bacteroidia bacterium]|nr:NAD(P)(+) transhydrogenase (Re/Si-specific) subunit beta [Bacteroidia bacterium]
MNPDYLLEIIYLIASVTFVIGLKMLSNPQTARRGNLWAAVGMGLAILGTIFIYENHEGHPTSRESIKMILIFGGLGIGSIIGWVTAKRVRMTAMPELVSLFNGMGGACAALISLLEFHHNKGNPVNTGIIMAGMIIGSVSFSGSMIALMKLNGTLKKSIRLPNYNIINTLLLIITVVTAVYVTAGGTESMGFVLLVFVLALLYGVFFVTPIGGADMPVVISLLNSFTGLAAAFGGFLYHNQVMLTGGILVGSAGTLLTVAMCNAMNRPLFHV